ncbi:MAG: putative glycoside hydrolase [Minisyncoccota bacterium]
MSSNLFKAISFAFCLSFCFLGVKVSYVSAATKFIPTFAVYYGVGISAASTTLLENFDLIDADRRLVTTDGNGLWSTIRAADPNALIYLYELGTQTADNEDTFPQVQLNSIARYNTVPSGSTLASLNENYPGLFLLDPGGNRIDIPGYTNDYEMDFGSTTYQTYWLTAVNEDIINQPWVADGIFADNCNALPGELSSTTAEYPTNSAWSAAMISFVSAITTGLHGYGQKLWCNMGATNTSAGSAVWLTLDKSPEHPDALMEEGAFARSWGAGDVQFPDEAEWLDQVNTEYAMQNTKVTMLGQTKLPEGRSGTDNWGNPVTFWQAFYYALGSFLLGKNDVSNNDYFSFYPSYNIPGNEGPWWYDEYTHIDLGQALGPFTKSVVNGVDLYWREFQKGYVVVNPTQNDVPSWTIPQPSQQLTHDNLLTSRSTIPVVTTIALDSDSAAILLKITPPSVPTNLSASTISSSLINISWTASISDIGVVGYNVYRNGTQIATTTSTSYSDTGLTASTAYSYSVSAYDAPGNTSVQSTSISATTTAIVSGTGGGGAISTSAPITCTSFTYSPWNACLQSNTQTRTVISALPQGCTGGIPMLAEVCMYTPPAPSVSSSVGTTTSGSFSTNPTPTSHAFGLTAAQIQAVLSLLSSFGADPTTLTRVDAALTGTVAPANISNTAASASSSTILSFGERSALVARLQQLLTAAGFSVSSTGYYGPVTLRAVERFQRTYSIVFSGTPLTTGYGLVGPRTWAKLQALEKAKQEAL